MRALILALAALGACRDRPPPGDIPTTPEPSALAHSPPGPASASASSPGARPIAAPASASAPESDPPPACSSPCGAGTSCSLTRRGPACTACAPGSLPACQDGRRLASCGDDGAVKTVDCAAKGQRCDRGRCVDRGCTPGALHCFERSIFRCDASGEGRTLVKSCEDQGPCRQPKGRPPVCSYDCDVPDHQIVALWDCGPCDWSTTAFCAEESNQPERACSDNICLHMNGERSVGFGVVQIPCSRSTAGLVVPGSDEQGPCEGSGPVGTRKIRYQVCKGGKPTAAVREAPCQR